MASCKGVPTPIEVELKYTKDQEVVTTEQKKMDNTPRKQAMGNYVQDRIQQRALKYS